MVTLLFWICVALIVYSYLGYPLLAVLSGICWKRPYRKEPITPYISLVIVAHNEEEGLGAKLENVLSQDYPRDLLEIIVASDGSTDRTNEIVATFADRGVTLLALPRGGKARGLNAAVGSTHGDVLVFSDANSILAPNALRNIVQPFADERIGGVAGNQVYQKSYSEGSAGAGEHTYWNFDRQMKVWQSRSGNVISATGAFYAIRRCLFMHVPEGVTDDFVTSTRVIAEGMRLVFEPTAICYEPVAGEAKAEFRRKTRVITRGLSGIWHMRQLLNPFRFGLYSLQLFSHKVMRRLVAIPVALLALLTPCLWLEGGLYRFVAAAQVLFYLAAVTGWILSQQKRKVPKLLALPMFFCMVNIAVLVACSNLLRGKSIHHWNPERGSTSKARPEVLSATAPHDLQNRPVRT